MRTVKYARTFEQMGLTDGDIDNDYRGRRALYALGAYCVIDRTDRTEEPLDTEAISEAMRDLVGDLGHLYQSLDHDELDQDGEAGDDFFSLLEWAHSTFVEEMKEEEAEFFAALAGEDD